MPISSACQRCQSRHVKCDASRPGCGQCISLKRECPGYATGLRFVDEGAKVQRRYRTNRRPKKSDSLGSHGINYSLETTAQSHPKEIGIIVSRVYNSDKESVPGRRTDITAVSTTTLSSIHTLSQGKDQTPDCLNFSSSKNLEPLVHMSPEVALVSAQSLANASNSGATTTIMSGDLAGSADAVALDKTLHLMDSDTIQDMDLGGIMSDLMLESEQEMYFLLRHYRDNISPWLDLCGQTSYFQTWVPCLAKESQILRYTTAAVAAYQLSRVGGIRVIEGGFFRCPAMTESYPNSLQVNWSYKAASYYHQALTHLRQYLPHPSEEQNLPQVVFLHGSCAKHPSMHCSIGIVLAATIILSIYDALNLDERQCYRHLSIVQNLLGHTSTAHPCLHTNTLEQSISQAKAASFWYSIQYDSLQAYTCNRRAIFNTNIERFWDASGSSSRMDVIPEQVLLFKRMIWILSRIINMVTSGKPAIIALSTKDLLSHVCAASGVLEDWDSLWKALDEWYTDLPPPFVPYARYQNPYHIEAFTSAQSHPFPEILYSEDTIATAMQNYRFSRLIMLLNKPVEHNRPAAQLRDYRELTKEVRTHCIEICGIAAGRPSAAVRISAVQPLFLAGQCLEDPSERSAVVTLLQEIESDVGWPTKHLVNKLRHEWNEEGDDVSNNTS